ncbi:MAG TPA: hypothetical protein VHX60_14035 [Acidobacteriaceae bacterium]|nr:hypothetical protein [Acidobacteriaceae bacterium]
MDLLAALAVLALWGNTAYNSILEATPKSPDGDPVHMRSPILWRNLLLSTLALGVAVLFLAFTL